MNCLFYTKHKILLVRLLSWNWLDFWPLLFLAIPKHEFFLFFNSFLRFGELLSEHPVTFQDVRVIRRKQTYREKCLGGVFPGYKRIFLNKICFDKYMMHWIFFYPSFVPMPFINETTGDKSSSFEADSPLLEKVWFL